LGLDLGELRAKLLGALFGLGTFGRHQLLDRLVHAGTSSIATIFSTSPGLTRYGLARTLLPVWAATVHSPDW
jgi:hypothetical protein